ncbi:MAG: AMP-binding protein [Flavipsychrobacter sp.]|nr:AMP-binding protein [Flavipsychrobacter sp.]
MYNAEIETMPLPRLRALQDQRLQDLVAAVYSKVPHYHKAFDELGIVPTAITSVKDIARLPFTKKSALRDNYPFDLFAVPMDTVSRLHCSSGTTGKPIVVGYTAQDLDVFSELIARSLYATGCRPGMKLQNAYGYGLFTGGLGLHYGAERLGMTVIPVSGGMTDRQLMLLKDFQPEALCCTPSYAQTIAEELVKKGMTLSDINLKYAILGAEPWTEAIRGQVEAGLNVKASNIYGLSEVMGPGVSVEDVDERGTGSYIWEDHFFPEIVDKDTGEPVPEGEPGVLVLTTLTKQAIPMIRYWTNDITNIYYDKGAKRTHIKMGAIRGRADDMLIIRGVNLFHTQVEDIIEGIKDISPNYQLIVFRAGNMDEVEVLAEVSENFLKSLDIAEKDHFEQHDRVVALRGFFSKKIKDVIGLSMRVKLVLPYDIPRSEGGKLNRITDKRKQ